MVGIFAVGVIVGILAMTLTSGNNLKGMFQFPAIKTPLTSEPNTKGGVLKGMVKLPPLTSEAKPSK